MTEKMMQDLLKSYPSELIEEGLSYYSREITLGSRRIDLAFLDRKNRLLLVEVQKGSLDTKHIDRHIDFVEGFLEKNPQFDIRLMYIANRIDHLRKTFLERRGYEYLEISEFRFQELMEPSALKSGEWLDVTSPSELESNAIPPTRNLIEKEKTYSEGPSLTLVEKFITLFGEPLDEILSAREIKERLIKAYPGTNPSSLIPSDYCYNKINVYKPSFTTPLFESIGKGQYKVLGKNYPYSGDIYWLDEKVGHWINGNYTLEKDPRK